MWFTGSPDSIICFDGRHLELSGDMRFHYLIRAKEEYGSSGYAREWG